MGLFEIFKALLASSIWKILQEWGFEINRFDSCVANNIINDKQCTII
jgi:hypothetical protein